MASAAFARSAFVFVLFVPWLHSLVFVSSSDWFIALFASVVIGQNNHCGFSFTSLD